MRGFELLTANLVALATGLLLFFLFEPPQPLCVAALFLAGMLIVQLFQMRTPPLGSERRGTVFRLFALLLNGLYGSFFAVLVYFLTLAATGRIGYPYD